MEIIIFMKVLITGAAGFIGSHTAERLKEMGHEVIGIDNFSPYYDVSLKKLNADSLSKKNIELLTIDLRTDDLVKELPSISIISFIFQLIRVFPAYLHLMII